MPKVSHATHCSFEQKGMMIDFLFNDKMTLQEASMKADLSVEAAIKFYAKQFVEPGRYIPAELNSVIGPYTHEQIKELIGYVIDDKMSVKLALSKVEGSGK